MAFPNTLILPFLLLSCFIFYFFLLSVHQCLNRFLFLYNSPRHGPNTHPLIGCLIPFYTNRHRLLDWYTDLLAVSPTQTIVMERLGARRTVVTADPKSVEYMLKTNFHNYPKGKPFTDILGDLLGCGIFNADGKLWHTQRKLASHEFTTGSLRNFLVMTLEAETQCRLLPILWSACHARRVVDLQDLLRRFAFDTICKVSLGTDPGFLDPSLPKSDLALAFDVASGISARRAAAPVFAVWKAKRALGIGSERQLREAVKLIHEYIMDIIRHRKDDVAEKGDARHDLLSRLISGGHDDEVIRDMAISFVMAGRDTTSSALTWFFWLVSCHPDIQREIVKEVMEAKGKIDYLALKEMRVLEAGLHESMRLYPPVVWDSKHAAGDDVLPDGTRVGRGDRVTYFPYGMGRMEKLWGEDWMEFKPRRWLEGREVVRVSPYKFAVFQGGPRVCLGKEMAFVQMKYIAASVLSRFELQRVNAEPPVMVPLLTAHMAGGLKVVVRERSLD